MKILDFIFNIFESLIAGIVTALALAFVGVVFLLGFIYMWFNEALIYIEKFLGKR